MSSPETPTLIRLVNGMIFPPPMDEIPFVWIPIAARVPRFTGPYLVAYTGGEYSDGFQEAFWIAAQKKWVATEGPIIDDAIIVAWMHVQLPADLPEGMSAVPTQCEVAVIGQTGGRI